MKDVLRPGHELVRKVRSGFIRKGSTLTAWCKQNGISVSGARQALIGSWNGPKGKELRDRIVKAADPTSEGAPS